MRWSDMLGQSLPANCIEDVVTQLDRRYPDGVIRIARSAVAEGTTIYQQPDGEWIHSRRPAATFALLSAVSLVGDVSPFLSQQWQSTKERLQRLGTA